MPSQAVEVSNGLYYLGEALDQDTGKVVEGYAIVKYKDKYKPHSVLNDYIGQRYFAAIFILRAFSR